MWPVFPDYLSVSYDYAGMYLFFEKGMRNGVPYFKNKYLKCYDPKPESKHST